MNERRKTVTVIPAKPCLNGQEIKRQLRVAAYCRVSTEEEEQQSSYEAQCSYYTEKIMSNPEWTMAGIFADEGISGTSAKKRPEFLRMIRQCRQKKIDLVLTKSISRFARNTVDCLNYIRVLRELGIGIYFEKENLNTLEADSELIITFMGAFAQSESESISKNVSWGKRQAMREGKTNIQYKRLYGYRKGADGTPEIIPEQAEIVQEIYQRYLAGDSLRMICDRLNKKDIPYLNGKKWAESSIRSILSNEKYRGDVLMQKTFIQDCISKKVIKNTGQLPMYLIENNHPAIVSKEQFTAVQVEMTRRSAVKSPSVKNRQTGQAHYAAKYALSERLVCGECGTLYRRCTWSRNSQKRIVWRCVSRLDYGKKYCHHSPTMEEAPLQRAILAAINSTMGSKEKLTHQITDVMEQEVITLPGHNVTLSGIQQRLGELETEFGQLLATAADGTGEDYTIRFREIAEEMASLKSKREQLARLLRENGQAMEKLTQAGLVLSQASPDLTEWREDVIRQLVHTVKVISKHQIKVYLCDGTEIDQEVSAQDCK